MAEMLLLALIVEAVVGYPAFVFARIGHPVTWAGWLIGRLDEVWNRGGALRRRLLGVTLVVVLVVAATLAGMAIETALAGSWGVVLLVLVTTTGLAQRSLDDHVSAVLLPLREDDLTAARAAVGHIVGRDTAQLDGSGVATAAIESLAESFGDGIVAPAFWFLVGGLPGLLACKAINTADSMIGHKDARHGAFGWAAARSDDLINLIPARLAGIFIVMAGGHGLAVMLRDARQHASPNAGWPEAAMAGALRRRLGGPVSYGGEPARRPLLGDGDRPDVDDLARARAIYRRACLIQWCAVGAIAWLA